MQPIIGAGPSMLTFFGDVGDKSFAPSIGRMGFNVSLSEYISRSLLFSARAMYGTLAGNETGARNINFESTIRSGGLHIAYNFDNFLPRKRRIDPFVLTGIEYFEYLTKTDLYDASGNPYYYWSDGSIMSIDENDPNAVNAVPLIRDYTYETDIRKINNPLFGKYSEHSFAVPVGVGVNLHLAPRWNFKLGATMHMTFTDYMDGVTKTNKGTGKGDGNKDNFLETYFTLTFDLFNPKPPYITPVSDADLLALADADTDGDGVIDFKDSCQGTPPGVAVDLKGCPLDTDGDGKPDYVDKEINSPAGSIVDNDGIAMNDSTIARKWHIWSDTANQYIVYDTIFNPMAAAGAGWNSGGGHTGHDANQTPGHDAIHNGNDKGHEPARDATIVYRRELVVELGAYKEGVPPTEMGKLLSVPDVKSSMLPDSSTAYTAGSYDKTSDANKRRDEMIAAGFPNAKVMVRNKDGALVEPTADILAGFKGNGSKPKNSKETVEPVNTKGSVVYRVQLGAYSKKLSSSVFKNAGAMMELKTEDGLYKYMSGSYPSIQDALQQRDELLKKGYSGAFVVAYKDSKRVQLSSVSGGVIQPKNENIEETKTPKSAIDKKLISFRIQVGAFVNDPPADIQKKLNSIPGLEKKKKSSGVTQYVAGRYNNYQDAQKFRDEISKKYGVSDAFTVAFFKEEMISVQEAIELTK